MLDVYSRRGKSLRRSTSSAHNVPDISARLRLEWSARARRDLLSIDAFYSQFGAAIAHRVTGVIVEAAVILELNPMNMTALMRQPLTIPE